MFLPSDEACSLAPNSQVPDPAASARAQSDRDTYDSAKMNANSDWLSLLSRDWRSVVDQGPFVAIQLRNSPTDINPASLLAGVVLSDNSGPAPTGVNLTTPGNPTGSTAGVNPSGSQPTRPRRPARNDDAEFVQTFGSTPSIQTYTGPLPRQGTVKSLIVGGANRPLAVGPAANSAATPSAWFGYGSVCPTDQPISMVPVGEPLYPNGYASSDGASTSGFGVFLALVGLAGLAYFTDQYEKKRGRRS